MRRPTAWTLRTRLVLVVALVAIAAIVVVDVATFSSLRGSLYERVDSQAAQALELPPPRPGSPGTEAEPLPKDGTRPQNRPAATPSGTWLGLYHPGVTSPAAVAVTGLLAASIGPSDQPAAAALADASTNGESAPRTVRSAAADGPRFRLAAKHMNNGDTFVVALPLGDVDATLDRLLRIEWIVGSIAALCVVLLALVTVRAGLRPLDSIARAAREVAAGGSVEGELSRRVPTPAGADTEVGRLAGALNDMLDRIDGSFAAQQATQEQLRRFIADASHELRTPLTSIRGFAELARTHGRSMTGAERDTALSRVEEEAEHLGRLVEDLLLLSRLDEGLPLHPEQVDVTRVVATAVDAARVIEPGRVVHFESSGAICARADRVRIRQLVDNLLANVRAHAGGDAQVEVRVRATEVLQGAAGGFESVIADTGVGLDAAQLGAATHRFWRAGSARAGPNGGGGLGVAVV
ncbi:MAG: HAMP domain-containing histidine kinase, partial [Thermoleophilia bacterium]|nr:HAMP domain-containing histidine kinase [Thermoleophilia bacterium]